MRDFNWSGLLKISFTWPYSHCSSTLLPKHATALLEEIHHPQHEFQKHAAFYSNKLIIELCKCVQKYTVSLLIQQLGWPSDVLKWKLAVPNIKWLLNYYYQNITFVLFKLMMISSLNSSTAITPSAAYGLSCLFSILKSRNYISCHIQHGTSSHFSKLWSSLITCVCSIEMHAQ